MELTREQRIELITAAIERIERAEARFREINATAGYGAHHIEQARARVRSMEAEFAWQWRNVKALLEGL